MVGSTWLVNSNKDDIYFYEIKYIYPSVDIAFLRHQPYLPLNY